MRVRVCISVGAAGTSSSMPSRSRICLRESLGRNGRSGLPGAVFLAWVRSRRTVRSVRLARPAGFAPVRGVGSCRPDLEAARGCRSAGTEGAVFSVVPALSLPVGPGRRGSILPGWVDSVGALRATFFSSTGDSKFAQIWRQGKKTRKKWVDDFHMETGWESCAEPRRTTRPAPWPPMAAATFAHPVD